MGVETVALVAHSFDLSELAALPQRLSQAMGEAWEWIDHEPEWSMGVCRLWMSHECLWLRGPSGVVNVGPRSASLSPYQRLHYSGLTEVALRACERSIRAAAEAFDAPLAIIVPDTGHPLSEAATWPHESWSMEEMLEVLPLLAPAATDLSRLGSYLEEDSWDELPYVLLACGQRLSCPPSDFPLGSFRYQTLAYDRRADRMLLSSQGASDQLILLGVHQYRYNREGHLEASKFALGTDWLEEYHRLHPLANPGLKHYFFDGLEVLAINHCLDI